MNWHAPTIRSLIQSALKEDFARKDATSAVLIPAYLKVDAVLVAKQSGVVCGLPLAALFFRALSRTFHVKPLINEGASVKPGQAFLRMSGSARILLAGERPALNGIQHLSGIATFTATQVRRLGRSPTRLYDTRKTLPGWRLLEKHAVRCGGGTNHRMSLGDAILVKENHLRIARLAGVPWIKALQAVRRRHPRFPVQVEIQTWQDLEQVLEVKPSAVLLDNQPIPMLRRMIKRLRQELPEVEIEISGGVRPEDLPRLARMGADRISMGRLTHSAPAFDCSLDILRIHA